MNERRIKTQIMLYFKFFGALLHNFTLISDDSCPTASIDAFGNLRYNDKFMDTMTEKEQIFIICHEILHAAFGHTTRIFKLNKDLWMLGNMAGDYLNNQVLVEFGLTMPDGCLYDPKYKVDTHTLEDVVRELLKTCKVIKIPVLGSDVQQGNGSGDQEEQQANTQEAKKFEQKMKQALVAATEIAKKQGKLPGSLERAMGELIKPKTNWRSELHDWFNVRIKTRRSYSRPNRRLIKDGLYVPTKNNLGCGHIGIGVDVSGSIGQKELDLFGSELNYLFESCSPRKITVVYFDGKVQKVDVYEDSPVKLVACGGGGTEFPACFDHFNKLEDPVDGMVFMSDGFGTWPTEPSYPVVMLSTTKETMPFGKTIHVEILNETQ